MFLRDLGYFLRVAETGSLRKAAQATDVTQPAITKGLRRLEAELGIVLVERTSRGAELTEVGRSFLERARRLQRDIETAMQEANDLRAGAQGLVRVGVTPALSEAIVQDAAMTLLAQRPAARVRTRIALSDELLTALRKAELDIVVSGIPDPAPDDLEVLPLGRHELGVLARAGHPLLAKRRPQLADAARCAWMLPRRGVLSRDWLDATFASHDLPRPLARLEFDPTHEGLMAIVLRSDLLTVGGIELCQRPGSPLGMLDIEALRWRRPVAALTRANAKLTPVVKRFLELLQARRAA